MPVEHLRSKKSEAQSVQFFTDRKEAYYGFRHTLIQYGELQTPGAVKKAQIKPTVLNQCTY